MNSDSNILIFAGAGASKAVAPELYPTTVEFFQDLPSNIKRNPLFTRVVEFLKDSSSNEPIDIELVLWRLQELMEFCSSVKDQESLPGWMLAENRLISALSQNSNQNVGHLIQIASTARQQLTKVIGEINARVYDLYSKLPPDDGLDDTWIPLLDQLSQIGPKIEVVTTNYDMVIEAALDKNKIADNGWRGTIVRSLDPDIWTADTGTRSKGLLTKLHGSVNWTRDNNQIYVSDPMFKGSHDSHVIIYPGFKGRPSDVTFQLFHNHFRKSLDSAIAVIFIGFAFRDEYINEICERGIKAQTITSVINPARVDLPFSSDRNQYIEAPFNSEAAHEVSKYIRKNIGV